MEYLNEQIEAAAPRERHTYIVAVYDTALAYGGPEEDGWWYDTGSLVRIVRVFKHEEKAYDFCRRLNRRLQNHTWGPNAGKPDKSSVISDGVYEASVHEDRVPNGYPETRPRYE